MVTRQMGGKRRREESTSKPVEREVRGLDGVMSVTAVKIAVHYGGQVAKKRFCRDQGCDQESQRGENWTKSLLKTKVVSLPKFTH